MYLQLDPLHQDLQKPRRIEKERIHQTPMFINAPCFIISTNRPVGTVRNLIVESKIVAMQEELTPA
jgi:hypothetical protein